MPSVANSGAGTRLLYFGCEAGEDVLDLQDILNAVQSEPGQGSIHPELSVDGMFGQKTLTRVREFQGRNGLVVDGLVGSGTWGALLGLPAGTPLSATQANGGVGSESGGSVKGMNGGQAFSKPINPTGGGVMGAGVKSGGGFNGGGVKSGGSVMGGGGGTKANPKVAPAKPVGGPRVMGKI